LVGSVEPSHPLIHHYYHVYADGEWTWPVSEHMEACDRSGLLEAAGCVNVGLVGQPDARDRVRSWLVAQNVTFRVVSEQDTGWEQVTQARLHADSFTVDGCVLYAHTKGAANPHVPVNHPWRRTMCYYNVTRWRESVAALREGYDVSGVYWLRMPQAPEHADHNWFFAGTYWWTTMGFLRGLQPPPVNHRWDAEGWIGYEKSAVMRVKDWNPTGMPGNFYEGPLW